MVGKWVEKILFIVLFAYVWLNVDRIKEWLNIEDNLTLTMVLVGITVLLVSLIIKLLKRGM